MSYMKNTVGNPRIGDIYDGVVVKILDYGVFVDFGCAQDGMVHISEIALHRVEEIAQVLTVGDKVKVKFIGFDPKGKAKLSIKRTLPGGESSVSGREPSIGEVYDGEVVKILDFGAFVDFGFSKDGMVHISEIAPQRVDRISQFLAVGDKVRVKFLGFDDKKRTKLSIKQA